MKSVRVLAALLALPVSSAVSAQDYDPSRPAIWSGFYAGVHGGWGKLQDSELKGFVGGGHAGFNVQNGITVTGIEADISYSDISFGNTVDFGPGIGPVTGEARFEYLASVRGRIGFTNADGTAMLYGTAGYGFSEAAVELNAPLIGVSFSDSEDLHGIVAGAGLEYKLSSNLSGRAEALHYWLGPDGPQWGGTTVVRAGLSYKFGN